MSCDMCVLCAMRMSIACPCINVSALWAMQGGYNERIRSLTVYQLETAKHTTTRGSWPSVRRHCSERRRQNGKGAKRSNTVNVPPCGIACRPRRQPQHRVRPLTSPHPMCKRQPTSPIRAVGREDAGSWSPPERKEHQSTALLGG